MKHGASVATDPSSGPPSATPVSRSHAHYRHGYRQMTTPLDGLCQSVVPHVRGSPESRLSRLVSKVTEIVPERSMELQLLTLPKGVAQQELRKEMKKRLRVAANSKGTKIFFANGSNIEITAYLASGAEGSVWCGRYRANRGKVPHDTVVKMGSARGDVAQQATEIVVQLQLWCLRDRGAPVGVPRTLEIGAAPDGRVVSVIERCDMTLDEYLHRGATSGATEAVHYLRGYVTAIMDVCRWLRLVNTRRWLPDGTPCKFMHRDLHSSNVMVSVNGSKITKTFVIDVGMCLTNILASPKGASKGAGQVTDLSRHFYSGSYAISPRNLAAAIPHNMTEGHRKKFISAVTIGRTKDRSDRSTKLWAAHDKTFPLQSHDCTLLLTSSYVRVQRVVKKIERELAGRPGRNETLAYARSLDAALKTHIRDVIAAATTLWYGTQTKAQATASAAFGVSGGWGFDAFRLSLYDRPATLRGTAEDKRLGWDGVRRLLEPFATSK